MQRKSLKTTSIPYVTPALMINNINKLVSATEYVLCVVRTECLRVIWIRRGNSHKLTGVGRLSDVKKHRLLLSQLKAQINGANLRCLLQYTLQI